MDSPIFSVVIPTHNCAQYVGQAVASALKQTAQGIEVLVIDDGSTDNTAEVLAPFGDAIHFLRQSNRGRAVARNAGIAQATGKYIAFLDADDVWSPSKLERQLALLTAHPELGLVYCWQAVIDANGLYCRDYWHGSLSEQEATGAWAFERLLLNNPIGASSTAVVPSIVLDQVGGFDETIEYIEDWDLWLRIAHRFRIGLVPATLVGYRRDDTFWPARVDRYRLPDTFVALRERFLAYLPASTEGPSLLHRRVLATAHLQGALIDYAMRRGESGQHRLGQALTLAPELLADENAAGVITDMVSFATSLRGPETPTAESEDFINYVFAHLPSSGSAFRKRRRSALSRLHLSRVYAALSQDEPTTAFRPAAQALAYQPSWLWNRGFVSTWVRSVGRAISQQPSVMRKRSDPQSVRLFE